MSYEMMWRTEVTRKVWKCTPNVSLTHSLSLTLTYSQTFPFTLTSLLSVACPWVLCMHVCILGLHDGVKKMD